MGKKMSTFALQLFLWCVLVMPPLSEASGSQCWRPNHTLLAEYDHPCEPSHDESFCCGVGWTCAYDKICYPTSALGSNWLSFTPTRGSCTDISWTSSECPNFCVSSLGMFCPLSREISFASWFHPSPENPRYTSSLLMSFPKKIT